MAKAEKPLRAWRISILRAKTVCLYLGWVEAPDEGAAIKKTIEEFRIDVAQRFRLIAQQVE
jgi:hypothetical protein